MSGTRPRQGLASYRDKVAELIRGGEPFGDVEHAIDEVADLTAARKAGEGGSPPPARVRPKRPSGCAAHPELRRARDPAAQAVRVLVPWGPLLV
jgi:hypothetical protein